MSRGLIVGAINPGQTGTIFTILSGPSQHSLAYEPLTGKRKDPTPCTKKEIEKDLFIRFANIMTIIYYFITKQQFDCHGYIDMKLSQGQ